MMRKNSILRSILGLSDFDPLPLPRQMSNKFISSPVVAQMRDDGVSISDLLAGLSHQESLESMKDGSRLSYTSGIASWINHCVMLNELSPGSKPPEDNLNVTEAEAMGWLTLIVKYKTAASYKSHLKFACALSHKSTAWDTRLVAAVIKAKQTGNPIDVATNKWVCQLPLLTRMVDYCDDMFKRTGRLGWVSTFLIQCYVFQWRAFSEYFMIRYTDIHFDKMSEVLGSQKVLITVDGRKNRDRRHTVSRDCTCVYRKQKGEVPLGAKLCPVHRLFEYLKSDTGYLLSRTSGSRELRLMSEVDQQRVNDVLREVAYAVDDPDARLAASHGPRRGYACDLALYGASLATILEKGDWRSQAFQAYLESIKDELHSRQVMRMVGDCSDSDGEDV